MKKLILILVAVLMASSCSEDRLAHLNQNIKDPASVSGESLFISAEKNVVDQVVSLNVNQNNTKLWSQFLQESTYTDESNYDQTGRSVPLRHWSALYKDVLKDLDEASRIITETTYSTPDLVAAKSNKLAVIEIVTVYTYSILVETFGDIPYTEALDPDNLSPKYDDALTIYKDLVGRLTAATNSLNTNAGSFNSADENIYDGNVAHWKTFANSLKLRMGILLADADNTFAQSTVESAVQGGVMTSSADNANYSYSSSDPNTNPMHVDLVLSGRQDYVAAVTVTDMLNALNDPRRPFFFTQVDGEYVGGEIGSTSAFADHSHVSAQVEAATAPGVIMDYAEVEFLLAEAAARNYAVGGSAKSHYDAGIVASILWWGGTQAEAGVYLAQAGVDYDTAISNSTASIAWKQVIGNQRWLGLFNRGLEAWTSIRRMDYPIMAVPSEALSGFPNRYTYPVLEQTLNGASYDAASAAIGGDAAETKLFFDKF